MWLLPSLGALSFAVWLILVFFRGDFWRADQRLRRSVRDLENWPEVAVIIPARDEAAVIAETVQSLLVQDYPGKFSIFLVDDSSKDDTAGRARGVADAGAMGERLVVLKGEPLVEGWTGKLWAMEQGVRSAASLAPDATYLLFTDADIAHEPASLKMLVAKAENEGLNLVSLMVRLRGNGFWERLLLPAFVFFFQMLYPFPWVNDPAKTLAAAAGGCMLTRRTALEKSGGLAGIQGALIDDCALARQIKATGPIWVGLTETTISIRPYDGLEGLWRMVTRTAYTELHHSPFLLAVALVGMFITYLLPPFLTLGYGLHGSGAGLGFGMAAWALMAASYRPSLRLYGEPPWIGILLPVVALFYCAMTFDSARRHWRNAGGEWKGRMHSMDKGK